MAEIGRFRRLENREIAVSQRKIIRFDEIWYTTSHLELDDSYVTKHDFVKFKMADGRHNKNRF